MQILRLRLPHICFANTGPQTCSVQDGWAFVKRVPGIIRQMRTSSCWMRPVTQAFPGAVSMLTSLRTPNSGK